MLNIKLNNLLNFVNPTDLKVLANNFMVLKDHIGWTNGYIADLTNLNTEHFEAVAKLKPKIVTRCITNKEKAPKISPLLQFKDLHEVENIELALETGFLKLVNKEFDAVINPIYLAYFAKNYGCDLILELQSSLKPVIVKSPSGDLVGLIMPVSIS